MASQGNLIIRIWAELRGQKRRTEMLEVETRQGSRGIWRWHAYDYYQGERRHRCDSKVQGFATEQAAIQDARDLLRPQLRFIRNR